MSAAATLMLEGMPEPEELRRDQVGEQVVLSARGTVLASYHARDLGMRNLWLASLRTTAFTGRRLAVVFRLSESYVATVYRRALREGSAGVVRASGRPPKLSPEDLTRARAWQEQGESNVDIGRRLGVHDTTIGRALPTRAADEGDATRDGQRELELGDEPAAGTEVASDPQSQPEPGAETGPDQGSQLDRESECSQHHQSWSAGGCAHVVGPPHVTVTGDEAVAVCHSLMVVHEDGQYLLRRATANHWRLRKGADGWRVTTRTNRVLDGRAEAPKLLGDGCRAQEG